MVAFVVKSCKPACPLPANRSPSNHWAPGQENFQKSLDEQTKNIYIFPMNLLSLHLRNPQTMPERFAWIMDALFCAIWEQYQVLPEWFFHQATRRIRRFGDHVNRILAALQAGTYRAPKPRGLRKSPHPSTATPTETAAETPPPAPATPPERLPRRRGWLERAMAGRYSGGQFEHLLKDPELIAAIQAAPALARPLRGLCHMLGIPVPDLIRLPERPRQPRPPKPPKAPREKVEKYVPYKYWMRTGPIFSERLRRFAKKARS
jgi:hypothetical protein